MVSTGKVEVEKYQESRNGPPRGEEVGGESKPDKVDFPVRFFINRSFPMSI